MSPSKVPPGPRGLWLLGNILPYARDPLGFLTRCARAYGDAVRLTGPGQTFYMFNHPEQIEQVLRSKHRHFIKWKPLRDTAPVFGSGLLTSEGDFWKRQRRLMNPAFQKQAVQAYADDMLACTTRHVSSWRDGEERVISDDMMRLTLAIIGRTLFDVDIEGEASGMAPVLGSVMTYYGDPANSLVLPQWVPTPANLRFRRAVRTLDGMIAEMIRHRRERGAGGRDLLSRLVAAQDEDGTRMTDRQLRDELLTLAFAGHKTTAAALTYSFYLLGQSPAAEARVAEEVRAVVGDREPTAEDVGRLTFTECVVKEALRLYPPSWGIGREAIEDCEIGSYTVPKGTQVMTVQYVVHRDGRWFAEPDEFRPERWENGLEESLPRCAYFPFGDGPRVCIGGQFAMFETVLLLATILRRFRLELVPGQKFRLVPSITLWPQPGIRMTVRSRHPT